jgi:hypothetical protein
MRRQPMNKRKSRIVIDDEPDINIAATCVGRCSGCRYDRRRDCCVHTNRKSNGPMNGLQANQIARHQQKEGSLNALNRPTFSK